MPHIYLIFILPVGHRHLYFHKIFMKEVRLAHAPTYAISPSHISTFPYVLLSNYVSDFTFTFYPCLFQIFTPIFITKKWTINESQRLGWGLVQAISLYVPTKFDWCIFMVGNFSWFVEIWDLRVLKLRSQCLF